MVIAIYSTEIYLSMEKEKQRESENIHLQIHSIYVGLLAIG